MDILEVVHIILASFIFDLFWIINLTGIYKERTENELANNRYWPWQNGIASNFLFDSGKPWNFQYYFYKIKSWE
jgi:hypothetical protein